MLFSGKSDAGDCVINTIPASYKYKLEYKRLCEEFKINFGFYITKCYKYRCFNIFSILQLFIVKVGEKLKNTSLSDIFL